jgi:hypothetical protein
VGITYTETYILCYILKPLQIHPTNISTKFLIGYRQCMHIREITNPTELRKETPKLY